MKYKDLNIPVQGQHIECKLFTPQANPNRISVIIVHGWTSSDVKYLPLGGKLSNKGYLVLAINLRGHINSPYDLDEYSRKEHEADVTAAVKYMLSKYPDNQLVLSGKSYGGYLSSIVATNEDIDYLILSQPALYPDSNYASSTKELITKDKDVFRQTSEKPETNKSLTSFTSFDNPVLFITSETDNEVPKTTTDNYLKYSPPNIKTEIINEADHSLTKEVWRQEYYNIILDWLDKVTK